MESTFKDPPQAAYKTVLWENCRKVQLNSLKTTNSFSLLTCSSIEFKKKGGKYKKKHP